MRSRYSCFLRQAAIGIDGGFVERTHVCKNVVNLRRELMCSRHPNVLRITGVSSPASLTHFIAYENGRLFRIFPAFSSITTFEVHYLKTADGPLAAALKDNLTRSIILGFKMVLGYNILDGPRLT
jgi:hypothetical protein